MEDIHRKNQARWYIAESLTHFIKKKYIENLEVNCDSINFVLRSVGDSCCGCTYKNYPTNCGGLCSVRDRAVAALRKTNGVERRKNNKSRRQN